MQLKNTVNIEKKKEIFYTILTSYSKTKVVELMKYDLSLNASTSSDLSIFSAIYKNPETEQM